MLASAASLVLAVTLAGCGEPVVHGVAHRSSVSAPLRARALAASATPSVSITPTNTIDGISVTGAFGKDPAIAFTSPMAIDQTRSKVLDRRARARSWRPTRHVDVNYHGVNMRTGKTFDNSFTQGHVRPVQPGRRRGRLQEGPAGQARGRPGADRDARAPTATTPTAAARDGSIAVGDSLVFVVDILDTSYDTPFRHRRRPERRPADA